MRLTVKDKAGMLTKITSHFSKHSISISQVIQEKSENGQVPLIILTHTTSECEVKKTVDELNALGVADVVSIIRVIS